MKQLCIHGWQILEPVSLGSLPRPIQLCSPLPEASMEVAGIAHRWEHCGSGRQLHWSYPMPPRCFYLLSVAAKINHCKLTGLSNVCLFSYSSVGQEFNPGFTRMGRGFFLAAPGENPFPCSNEVDDKIQECEIVGLRLYSLLAISWGHAQLLQASLWSLHRVAYISTSNGVMDSLYAAISLTLPSILIPLFRTHVVQIGSTPPPDNVRSSPHLFQVYNLNHIFEVSSFM